MKKKLIALLTIIGCAAAVTTLTLGGGQNFEANATGKSFVFADTTGSQFKNDPSVDQIVDVTTGSTSPIRTIFMAREISSLTFGEGGKFVEAHPIAEKLPYYSLDIGINNLTNFEIDMGVTHDGGGLSYEDTYYIELVDKDYNIAKDWYSQFEVDGDGNGTVHIEWNKDDYEGTVVQISIKLEFEKDSESTSLYIESMTLSWNC